MTAEHPTDIMRHRQYAAEHAELMDAVLSAAHLAALGKLPDPTRDRLIAADAALGDYLEGHTK